jgi:hypothetical protein
MRCKQFTHPEIDLQKQINAADTLQVFFKKQVLLEYHKVSDNRKQCTLIHSKITTKYLFEMGRGRLVLVGGYARDG